MDSHLLPEFSTSTTDFYLLKGERNGNRQLINHQAANSASSIEKPQYLLNVTLRNPFLSEVLVHKQQCIQIAHAPVQQLIWHSWINLVEVEQTTKEKKHTTEMRGQPKPCKRAVRLEF